MVCQGINLKGTRKMRLVSAFEQRTRLSLYNSVESYTYNWKKVQKVVLGSDDGVVASREIGLTRNQRAVAPVFLSELHLVLSFLW